MKKQIIVGQISLFGEEPKTINEVHTTKEKDDVIFNNLIEKYKNNCSRIAKVENNLFIEIDSKTLAFNPKGENYNCFIKDMLLRPKDTIVISNKEKPVSDEQIKMLKRIDAKTVIKRKSDNNIIIPMESFCITIYPTGHTAKWNHKAVYNDNEVFPKEQFLKNNSHEKGDTFIEEVDKTYVEAELKDDELNVGDKVRFNYNGIQEGKIVRIYNKGETVNVIWGNKHTAFYFKSVEKIYA